MISQLTVPILKLKLRLLLCWVHHYGPFKADLIEWT